ncbi:MAG: four helix bundle protein [Leptolyngbya sp. SIO4C5]|nr:four helix bundle protein [Leptolyngbya sp. SIO4C5]
MPDFIHTYQELQVYQLAFNCVNEVYHLSRSFPKEEEALLTRQTLTASRAVCASIAEAWGKRRYRKAFVAKLSDAQAEAAEMQTWIEIAVLCGYLSREVGQELSGQYRLIFAALERLIENASVWVKSLEGAWQ